MASTYVNDLRLEEMATGDQSGTWGDTTNTNLELIAEAFSYGTQASFGSDADATTTIADGASDPARSLYLKVTSGVSLTATRTLTIAPNTVSKIWIIENATSGSQSISISQGSGANVTIPNGDVKVIYTDGAGAGAAVVDAFTDLNTSGTLTATNLAGTLTTAAQTNITSVGALDGGSITSGFGSIDVGSSAITTTGTVTGGTLAGTLSTAAQPNITSVGTLTGFTSTGIDDNATSTAITIDSSQNVGINTSSAKEKLDVSGAAVFTGSHATGTNAYGAAQGVMIHATSSTGFVTAVSNGANDVDLQLRGLNGGNANANQLVLDSSGNVGIGTASPSYTLDVEDSNDGHLAEFRGAGTNAGGRSINIGVGNTNVPELPTYQPYIYASASDSANNSLALVSEGGTSATGGIDFYTGTVAAGTARRMRIDRAGNVGIGTTSPSATLNTQSTVPDTNIRVGYDANKTTRIGTTSGGDAQIYAYETGVGYHNILLAVDSGSAAGNVGIATSSPAEKLEVAGSIKSTSRAIAGSATAGVTLSYDSSNSIAKLETWTSKPFSIETAGVERMRIDASGNVGIGVSSPQARLHVSGVAPTYTNSSTVFYGGTTNNGTHSGVSLWSSGNALNGGIASNLLWDNGTVSQTNTARSSGTIYFGNTTVASKTSDMIFGGYVKSSTSLVERMRIDGSGNLLVGKTSTSQTVEGIVLQGADGRLNASADGNVAGIFNRLTNDGDIFLFRKDGTDVGSIGVYSSDRLYIGAGDTNITFKPSDDILYPSTSTGFARDATISFGDSGARFKDLYLSGIINPDALTNFINEYSATVANGDFVYIGSSGSVTVGVQSVTSRTPMSFRNPNGEVGTISTSGSSTSYNTSSDYRLKENVVEMTGALDRVNQLQPKRFNFIADADTTVDGFLAHEVSDIVPEAIHGEKDAVKEEEYEITPAVLDDDGNVVTEAVMGTREVPEYQGIDQSKLVPLLTKAIQEQQTIIDDLKTRIEALEG